MHDVAAPEQLVAPAVDAHAVGAVPIRAARNAGANARITDGVRRAVGIARARDRRAAFLGAAMGRGIGAIRGLATPRNALESVAHAARAVRGRPALSAHEAHAALHAERALRWTARVFGALRAASERRGADGPVDTVGRARRAIGVLSAYLTVPVHTARRRFVRAARRRALIVRRAREIPPRRCARAPALAAPARSPAHGSRGFYRIR